MFTARRLSLALIIVAAVVAGAVYLRDPAWAGDVTSGMRPWEQDRVTGDRVRWTTGRASFFVPSGATSMTLPLRAGFPGPNGGPTVVAISVDGRKVADIELVDPSTWVRAKIPFSGKPRRRFRRIDLHVNRVIADRILGVQTGEIEVAGR